MLIFQQMVEMLVFFILFYFIRLMVQIFKIRQNLKENAFPLNSSHSSNNFFFNITRLQTMTMLIVYKCQRHSILTECLTQCIFTTITL